MFWFLLGVGALAATSGIGIGAGVGHYLATGRSYGYSPLLNYLGNRRYQGQFYGSYGQPYFYPQYTYQYPYSYWRPYVPMFGY